VLFRSNTDLENNKEEVVSIDETAKVDVPDTAALILEIDDLKDKLLRLAAEHENMKRRHEKHIDDIREYAITNLSKDLMSVMDNLSRALEHSPKDNDDTIKNFVIGVEMTKNELESVFKKHHIESIAPEIGEKFDYNLHHAILQVPTNDHKQGVILQVMQTGYKIKDRLVRPATVSVSKAVE
jgi:molecular chaperone GrpE